ncbi:hypothetical protein VAEKB19_2790002 [Vibrio aestuarianus]|nr:hypothetical protein VAEKB19_2790002 [Vibrio aestuarianus]
MLFIVLVFLRFDYYQSIQPNIWGDKANEPYITITGKKPSDAHLEA